MKPAQKLIAYIFVFFLTVLIFPTNVVNSQETPAVTESVAEKNARELQDLLQLVLPEQTDNPNYLVKFVDPSSDQSGVKVQIDGGAEEAISSPYTLPALVVGDHTLLFKFKDAEGTNRELEKSIVILPRIPEISANKEITTEGKLKVSGTAVGQSDIILLLATPTEPIFGQATSDVKGDWSYEFEGSFIPGVYTLVAQTQKKGFKSDYSLPLNFELVEESSNNPTNEVKPEDLILTNFVLKEFNNPEKASKIFGRNPDLIIYSFGVLILGVFLASILGTLVHSLREGNKAKKFKQVFKKPVPEESKDKKDSSIESKLTANKSSLREKFEKAGLKPESLRSSNPDNSPEAKEAKAINNEINQLNNDMLGEQSTPVIENQEIIFESHSEPKEPKRIKSSKSTTKKSKPTTSKTKVEKKGKTMSKEEFLKEFKNFAPKEDKVEGEERNIKISLNSKEVKK